MNYGIIGGIVILAILIFVVVMQLRKSSDKKAAGKFLESLGDKIQEIILNTITCAEPGEYQSLEEFEKALMDSIYSNVWDYVSAEVQSSADINVITKAVFKYVDKNMVVDFINSIIDKNDISDRISNVYGTYKIENSNIESEDKALNLEYSDQSQYVEESNDNDLPKAEPETHTEEETNSLNPQKDEEEAFDVEDDSMEVVTDKKEIITTVSKSGQTLYYEIDANGKKTRVSKEYALKNM